MIRPTEALRDLDLSTVRRVALGGFVNHRKPLALMLALAEAQPGFAPEELVCLSGSVDLDLALVLWPSLQVVHCPFQGVEGLATISPLMRQRLESRTMQAPPWDTGLLSLALRTPIGSTTATFVGLGTDLPLLNPRLEVVDNTVQVQALPIDLALLHVPQVGSNGDLWYVDSPWGDGLLIAHSAQLIASVGAIGDAPPDARCYVIPTSACLIQLDRPTGPTADPPRCEVEIAALQEALRIAAVPLADTSLIEYWRGVIPPARSGLIKSPTQRI